MTKTKLSREDAICRLQTNWHVVDGEINREKLTQLLDACIEGGTVNLAGADLRDADLTGVNLYSAILRDADLRGAILAGVNFDNVNFDGAKLSGANFDGAKNVELSIRTTNPLKIDSNGNAVNHHAERDFFKGPLGLGSIGRGAHSHTPPARITGKLPV